VSVDLSPLNGSAPYAIAYAFENQKDTCCNAGADPGEHDRHGRFSPAALSHRCCGTDISNGFIECTPASCPIQLPDSRAPFGALPANPFIAKIKDGKCECLEPQVCSETV